MTAQAILDSLHTRGAVVTVEDSILWVEPDDLLTDADCEAIRKNKSALVSILQTAGPGYIADSRPAVVDAGSVYNPALAAAHARGLYRLGKITEQQRDTLLHYAHEASRANAFTDKGDTTANIAAGETNEVSR